MLPFELWLTVFAGLNAVRFAIGKPTFHATVELMRCPSTGNSTTIDHCATICQPIQVARDTCEGTLDCTCLHAPPESVQACLQCHLESDPASISRRELDLDIPTRIARYLFVCNGILPSVPQHSSAPSISGSWSSESEQCIFGLPDIVMSDISSLSAVSRWQNPWFMLIVIAVIVLYIADARKRAT
ncbi:hypothetical protein QCA50_016173 [Cerrena zonata]|uniref:Integral membrane protein n=1 Tax=Cerrena zonata TaxID=2478898 RepID=A0AAW0FIH4_9APHY